MGQGTLESLNSSSHVPFTRRRRIQIACNACRKSKQKCTGTEHNSSKPCDRCRSKSITCVYERDSSQVAGFENHLARIEWSLSTIRNRYLHAPRTTDHPPCSSPSTTSTTSTTSPNPSLTSSHFPSMQLNFGSLTVPTHAKVDSRSSPETSAQPGDPSEIIDQLIHGFGNFTLHVNNIINQPFVMQSEPPQPTSQVTQALFPAPEVVNRLVNLYFDYKHSTFPFIYRKSFLAKLNSPTNPPPPALVLALMAHGSKFANDMNLCVNSAPETTGSQFIEQAKLLAWRDISRPSVTTVQVLLLVCTFEDGSSRFSRAPIASATAARMCYLLRLNREQTYCKMSLEERIVCRAVFICTWLLDTAHGCSEAIDLPFSIPEDTYDTNFWFSAEELAEMPELKHLEVWAILLRLRRQVWPRKSIKDSGLPPLTHQQLESMLLQLANIHKNLPPHLRITPIRPQDVHSCLAMPPNLSPFSAIAHLLVNLVKLELCYFSGGSNAPSPSNSSPSRMPSPSLYHETLNDAACNITYIATFMNDRTYFSFTFNLLLTIVLSAARIHLNSTLSRDPDTAQLGFLWLSRNLNALLGFLNVMPTVVGREQAWNTMEDVLRVYSLACSWMAQPPGTNNPLIKHPVPAVRCHPLSNLPLMPSTPFFLNLQQQQQQMTMPTFFTDPSYFPEVTVASAATTTPGINCNVASMDTLCESVVSPETERGEMANYYPEQNPLPTTFDMNSMFPP
ncbi:uncharacterized protein VTP21DRAFT_6752 [Calcarisporiella thermophila]|uniref:uncharacterized protein n=1 Tax=Calcarisporiella thermophila TaxID=911321 RepID=UPI003742777F